MYVKQRKMVRLIFLTTIIDVCSFGYQLTGRKSNLIFQPLRYLVECIVASIQQLNTIKCVIPTKQIDDVIIATSNICAKTITISCISYRFRIRYNAYINYQVDIASSTSIIVLRKSTLLLLNQAHA